MRTIQLGVLVGRCQRRADKRSDPHVDDWKGLISEKYGELHSIVSDAGWAYFEDTEDITATGAAAYALPSDLLSLGGVDFMINSTTGARRSLHVLMPQERADWSGATGSEARRFAFTAGSIELWPRPSSGLYRVTYIPQPADYDDAEDTTELDVVNSDGAAFLIWGVAAMAKDRSESDLRWAASQSEAAGKRLQSWAVNRAIHEPRRQVVVPSPCVGPGLRWDSMRGWLT